MRVVAVAIGALLFLPLGAKAECIGGPSTSFKLVVSGGFSTCGLTAQGVAYCWGSDDGGRLGDGGAAGDSQSPVAVDITPINGEKAFIQLTAGDSHFCGLTSQGAAYCWGHDSHGQLGDGGGSSDAFSPVGVDTSGMTGPKAFVALSAGGNHTCGLTGDGAAWCWGDDTSGQLGDGGGASPSQVPVTVNRAPANDRAFVQIAAGTNHTCALTAQGAVYCWGADDYGQLGDGTGASPSQSPVATDRSPANNKPFARLAAGFHHTCGLTAEGVAYCWGDGSDGQLGDGGVVPSFIPSAVDMQATSGKPFAQVTAGSNHTCGLTYEGVAYCWGADNEGSLGNGGTSTPIHVPSPVDAAAVGNRPLVGISAGGSHTCGLTAEHTPYCWGGDTYGQLGDGGTSTPAQSPVAVDTSPITGEVAFIQLIVGDNFTCGLTGEGTAYCWGHDAYGQLGDGDNPIDDCGVPCSPSPLPVDTSPITGDAAFVQLSTGSIHTCGLTGEGLAYCWGRDGEGQLGNGGSSQNEQIPAAVDTSPITGEAAFVQLTGGSRHACGFTGEGVAYCWGYDLNGQLGDGDNPIDTCSYGPCSQSPVPVDTFPITGEAAFVQLVGGGSCTCGLTSEGVAYCWGMDGAGQLGDGGISQESQSPVAVDTSPITGEAAFVQLAGGLFHTCGLTCEGVAYCWGQDRKGQLGDGGISQDAQSPVAVDTSSITGEAVFVQLIGGGYHTCGLTSEGVVYCWGLDLYGQLGNGYNPIDTCDTDPCSQSPVLVDTSSMTGEAAFVQLTGGADHTCGLTGEGLAYCWGLDYWGQLGDGGSFQNSQRAVPIDYCPITCVTNEDCPLCMECSLSECVNQIAGSDLKEECPQTECLTGLCDGNRSCGREPDGTSCGDQSDTACDNRDTCQNGSCRGNFETAGTPCTDDGLYCSGDEVCDGLGACVGTGDPCSSPRICDEDADACVGVGCASDADCGPCQWCNASTCENQLAGQDLKNDCPPVDCLTGDCDGSGACGTLPAGLPCTDDGLHCNGTERCDGGGNCVGDGNPCAPQQCRESDDACVQCLTDADCPECQWCNNFDCDNRPAGIPCTDDGLYCTGVEECNGAGGCESSGNPCSGEVTECYGCQETEDSCFASDTIGCGECKLCDGAGECDQSRYEEDEKVCRDMESTCQGTCFSGVCVVEAVCDEPITECGLTKFYPEDEGHCRIPEERIFMDAEVEPASVGIGEFMPVRIILTNRWDRALLRMSVTLRLNPPNADGSERAARVAYVCDSALCNGGELSLVETRVEGEELVRLDLADDEDGLPGRIVLDLMLLMDSGPAEDTRFEVDVWAPCESMPQEVGCHVGYPDYPGDPPMDWRLQRVAYGLKMDLLGATYDANDQRSGMLHSPVLGCQCGAAGGNGILLLLVLALAIRRFR